MALQAMTHQDDGLATVFLIEPSFLTLKILNDGMISSSSWLRHTLYFGYPDYRVE